MHNGHLHCANTISAMYGNAEVHLMLAARPNLKKEPMASVEQRWQMLQSACASYPYLRPDDMEIRREGRSTTAETAIALGAKPTNPVIWILGSDTITQLAQWRDQAKLRNRVSFLIVTRPGYRRIEKEHLQRFQEAKNTSQLCEQSGQYSVLDVKMLDLSSTDIRRQASAGMYINGLVPYEVYRYIRRHSLYLDKETD